jgi:hypothetical protein
MRQTGYPVCSLTGTLLYASTTPITAQSFRWRPGSPSSWCNFHEIVKETKRPFQHNLPLRLINLIPAEGVVGADLLYLAANLEIRD